MNDHTEPTPGHPRTERWTRDDDGVLVYVNSEGLVTASAEAITQLLIDAGWERAE